MIAADDSHASGPAHFVTEEDIAIDKTAMTMTQCQGAAAFFKKIVSIDILARFV